MYYQNFETYKNALKDSKAFQIVVQTNISQDATSRSSKIDIGQFQAVCEEIEALLGARMPLSVWGGKTLRMIPYETIQSVSFSFVD